jgi:hypothetical protein
MRISEVAARIHYVTSLLVAPDDFSRHVPPQKVGGDIPQKTSGAPAKDKNKLPTSKYGAMSAEYLSGEKQKDKSCKDARKPPK